ncbi:hypothetical protein Ct9H90mP29_02540 [bacterium]|nr:MAG: hypothetical protein Ct9H90mP29_02540 [bacterium]
MNLWGYYAGYEHPGIDPLQYAIDAAQAEVLNFMLGLMFSRPPAFMKEHQHRLIQNGYVEIEMGIQ